MNVTQLLVHELQREGDTTALTLERVPLDQLDWRPQQGSMTLGELVSHIAVIPGNARRMLEAGECDLGQGQATNAVDEEIAETYRQDVEQLATFLAQFDDAALERDVRFTRRGELMTSVPVIAFIRNAVMNHSYHHRGQLSVYLSLLEVSMPEPYASNRGEQKPG